MRFALSLGLSTSALTVSAACPLLFCRTWAIGGGITDVANNKLTRGVADTVRACVPLCIAFNCRLRFQLGGVHASPANMRPFYIAVRALSCNVHFPGNTIQRFPALRALQAGKTLFREEAADLWRLEFDFIDIFGVVYKNYTIFNSASLCF